MWIGQAVRKEVRQAVRKGQAGGRAGRQVSTHAGGLAHKQVGTQLVLLIRIIIMSSKPNRFEVVAKLSPSPNSS